MDKEAEVHTHRQRAQQKKYKRVDQKIKHGKSTTKLATMMETKVGWKQCNGLDTRFQPN